MGDGTGVGVAGTTVGTVVVGLTAGVADGPAAPPAQATATSTAKRSVPTTRICPMLPGAAARRTPAHEEATAVESLVGIGDSILDAIGSTPLVPLRHIRPRSGARILVKLECRNPTGSM